MRIMTPQFFKRDMYLAKQGTSREFDDDGNPIDNYQEPIPFLGRDGVNYQPLTAETDIQRYGTASQEIIKAVIMNTDKAYSYFDEDSVGDLVYLFGASPYKQPSWDRESMEVFDDYYEGDIHIRAFGNQEVLIEMVRHSSRGKELIIEIVSSKTNNVLRTMPSGKETPLKVGKNRILTKDTHFQIVGEVDMVAKDLVLNHYGEPRNGYWANYTVDAVMPMLTHVNVFFKKHKRTGAM